MNAVAATQSPAIGTIIGSKFRLERLLGEGGMGAVFEATHTLTGKRVALKWLHARATSEEAVQRFLREAQAAARVDHPNVVDVYDVGTDGDGQFLVMELLRGEPLSALVERGPIAPEKLARIMVPAIRAVGAAHREQVVHRDLKPDNVFLCYTDEGAFIGPKILDFGISKITNDFAPSLTASGTTMGTPYYMSPEQIRNMGGVDPRTDVYALGVILYEGLTGRVPFEGDSYGAIAIEVATGAVVPPSRIRPGIPKELDAIVLRAMARKPDDRFQTATELASALAAFAGSPITQPGPSMDFTGPPRILERPATGAQPRPATGPVAAPSGLGPLPGPPLGPPRAQIGPAAAASAPAFGPPRVQVATPAAQPAIPGPELPTAGRPSSAAHLAQFEPRVDAPVPKLESGPQLGAGREPSGPFGTGSASAGGELRLPSFAHPPAPASETPFAPPFGSPAPGAPFGGGVDGPPLPAFAARLGAAAEALPEPAPSRRAERRPVRAVPPPQAGRDRTIPIAIGVASVVALCAIGAIAYFLTSGEDPAPVAAPVVPIVPAAQAPSEPEPEPARVAMDPIVAEPVAAEPAAPAPEPEPAQRVDPASAMRPRAGGPVRARPRSGGLSASDF